MEDVPLELSEAFVGHLESLMLAQAQECVWQRAVMGESLLLRFVLVLTLVLLSRQLQERYHCKAGDWCASGSPTILTRD